MRQNQKWDPERKVSYLSFSPTIFPLTLHQMTFAISISLSLDSSIASTDFHFNLCDKYPKL